MSKYRNIKINTSIGVFDSKLEFKHYQELVLLQNAKLISNLQRQYRIPLLCKEARLSYIADFVYFDNKRQCYVIADTKGILTDVYKIKKKILLSTFSNIIILELFKDKTKENKPYGIAKELFTI